MKIRWIEYENLTTGLMIERIQFYDDVTLLVGLTGAGKTQILHAIYYSLLIVRSNFIPQPCHAVLGLEIGDDLFEWSYRIERNTSTDILLDETDECIFTYEKLTKNNVLIYERNGSDVKVEGYERVPQPKYDESLLVQYSDDKQFKSLTAELRKIYSIDMEIEIRGRIGSDSFNAMKSRVLSVIKNGEVRDFKRYSHLPVVLKLYIAKRHFNELFTEIFDNVKELFMEIEDFDVIEDKISETYQVCMTVNGKKLMQNDISNGMLKTIYYVVELLTMSENSVALIDEFENGLGVNCIDVLCDLLLSKRDDLQFIITSHHPKIINTIEMERWKIIDRNTSTVMNSDYREYGIGNSQHDAYFNLINRWEYEGKI